VSVYVVSVTFRLFTLRIGIRRRRGSRREVSERRNAKYRDGRRRERRSESLALY